MKTPNLDAIIESYEVVEDMFDRTPDLATTPTNRDDLIDFLRGLALAIQKDLTNKK